MCRRNVGIGPAVEASFFKIIADVKKELECCHIDAYIACLTTNPEFAGIKKWDSNVTLTSTSFLVRQSLHFFKDFKQIKSGKNTMLNLMRSCSCLLSFCKYLYKYNYFNRDRVNSTR